MPGYHLSSSFTGIRRHQLPPFAPPLMVLEDQRDKRSVRRELMSKETFKRGSAPFPHVQKEVSKKMSERFKSEIIDEMKELSTVTKGDGNQRISFTLAKDYGFCWGVDRSIELAWAAREAYPDSRMHITNELIHNPGVNDLLRDMDINFIEKTEEGKRFDDVQAGDVVILPAFGATLGEMELLDKLGVTTVDTTCPWVSKVWNAVDKHRRKDMTSIIHGKYAHEESLATASMADTYLIVKDLEEAEFVCSYILGEQGCATKEEFLQKFKKATSEHFDPEKHLKKVGVANQTTMYKKETRAISKLIEKTMVLKFGPENAAEHFAAFDTICDATQVRQDAITEMVEAHQAKTNELDFILVVGGWDSSNTAHLLEIPHHAGVTAYHIDTAERIRPDGSIQHRTVSGDIEVTDNFLPMDRPAAIGVTSGASTPDSSVAAALENICLLKGLSK